MNTISISPETDGITTIQLLRGKANAINGEMVSELREALYSLANSADTAAVIVTGHGSFFSAGLDVMELYNYNEAQLIDFWRSFGELIYEMNAFPKPLLAAVNGHSPAGGCVLALCCDYVVMDEGIYRIGLNELEVGIVIPGIMMKLLSHRTGGAQAYQLLMTAKMLTAGEACDAGIVDQVSQPGTALLIARERCASYLQFPGEIWSDTKLNLKAGLLKELRPDFHLEFERTFKQWWKPATRERLLAVINRIGKKA